MSFGESRLSFDAREYIPHFVSEHSDGVFIVPLCNLSSLHYSLLALSCTQALSPLGGNAVSLVVGVIFDDRGHAEREHAEQGLA